MTGMATEVSNIRAFVREHVADYDDGIYGHGKLLKGPPA